MISNPPPRNEGELATIIVGPKGDHTHYRLSVEALSQKSPFFDKALNGRFKEGENKEVLLPDDDPLTFASFATWLEESTSQFESEMKNVKMMGLLELWVMADKFQIPSLQNTIMTTIVNQYSLYNGKNLSPEVFNFVYQNSAPSSLLRRVLVDFALHRMDMEFFSKHRSELEVEFIEDFCIAQMKTSNLLGKGRRWMSGLNQYSYYVPDEEQPAVMEKWRIEILKRDPEYGSLARPATSEQLEFRKISKPRSRKPRIPSYPQL